MAKQTSPISIEVTLDENKSFEGSHGNDLHKFGINYPFGNVQ